METREQIGYRLYKKWFTTNFVIFIVAIILFIVCIIFKAHPAILCASFMFTLMTIGWGLTAFVGMKSNKKGSKKNERNSKPSIS